MANNQRRVDRMKVKEMVEGWNGRKLPKKISLKTLIEMVSDEAILTDVDECDVCPVPIDCGECHLAKREEENDEKGFREENM